MDSTFYVSPLEKAESLNQYFRSIFVDANIVPISPDLASEHLNSIGFTKEIILEKLQALNRSKSQGADGWHPYFLTVIRGAQQTFVYVIPKVFK